jgi:AcrR family transcriptional regulator
MTMDSERIVLQHDARHMIIKPEDDDCHARRETQMRDTSHRKAETRERILQAAASLFRQHGIDGVGVDAVMHEAGLTHGGFYAHFPSKEALVAAVAAASLVRSAAKWDQLSRAPDPAAALARIVEPYLDPAHVATAGSGCMLPAIGAEMARRPEVRQAISASIRGMVDALARCRPGQPRGQALAALSCMVGAVVLARLSDTPELATSILDAARTEIIGQDKPVSSEAESRRTTAGPPRQYA